MANRKKINLSDAAGAFMERFSRVQQDTVHYQKQVMALFQEVRSANLTSERFYSELMKMNEAALQLIHQNALLAAMVAQTEMLPIPADRMADLQMIGEAILQLDEVSYLALAGHIINAPPEVVRQALVEIKARCGPEFIEQLRTILGDL